MTPDRKPEPGPNIRHLRAIRREWSDTIPEPEPPPEPAKPSASLFDWATRAMYALAVCTLGAMAVGWL